MDQRNGWMSLLAVRSLTISLVILAASVEGSARAADNLEPEPVAIFEPLVGLFRFARFSRDEKQLVAIVNMSADLSWHLRSWRIATRQKVLDYELAGRPTELSPNGELYARADHDERLCVHRVDDNREIAAWSIEALVELAGGKYDKSHPQRFHPPYTPFTRDNRHLVFFLGPSGRLMRLPLLAQSGAGEELVGDEPIPLGVKQAYSLHPGNRVVVSITDHEKMHVWNEALKDIATLPVPKNLYCDDVYEEGDVVRVLCHQGPRWMVFERSGPTLRLIREGLHPATSGGAFNSFSGGGLCGKFSWDGQLVVTGLSGFVQVAPTVRIWSLASAVPVRELRHSFRGAVDRFGFSPSSRFVYTYVQVYGPSGGIRLYVWDLGSPSSQSPAA